MEIKRSYVISIAILILLTLSSVITFTLKPKTFDSAKQLLGQIMGDSAPRANHKTFPHPNLSPEELNITAQTYVRPQPHTSIPIQTLYFDEDGQAIQHATENGFYREIFGKTADGRLMAQDFFQATQLPQTSAFTLKQGSDGHQFDTNQLDGRNFVFAKDGSLRSVADYAKGVLQGAHIFYQNKQMVGAILAQEMLVFYDDGNILASMSSDKTQANTWQITLFRQNGLAMLQTTLRNNVVVKASAWTIDGQAVRKKADVQKVRQESLPFEQKADAIFRLINEASF